MCGIGGIVSLDREIPFNIILDMLESMKMRGTEHGAGFAAYSPTENGLIRFRFFAEENDINVLTTRLNEYIHLGKVSKIAQLNSGGEIIHINDMSLPYGGGFDIYGCWERDITDPNRGHSEHRTGNNADIHGTGQNQRFRLENTMIKIRDNIADILNLDITWS
jgi:hypothetical protein